MPAPAGEPWPIRVLHPLTLEEWGVQRFFYRDNAGRDRYSRWLTADK